MAGFSSKSGNTIKPGNPQAKKFRCSVHVAIYLASLNPLTQAKAGRKHKLIFDMFRRTACKSTHLHLLLVATPGGTGWQEQRVRGAAVRVVVGCRYVAALESKSF